MSNYKTQCPRCHTIYPMPASKLGDDKARANCGKCQHTFFLNAHLIEDKSTPTNNQPKAAQSQIKPQAKIAKDGPADGMIFDKMPIDSKVDKAGDISMDGLDEFMAQTVNTKPLTASKKNTEQHDDNDEAWLDELIKSDNSSKIQTVTSRPNDNLSELLGADFNNLIPEAGFQESPEVIRKKINERIIAHPPTQEQLVTRRSFFSQFLWLLGSLVMIGLLAAQYVFFNANSVAKTDKAPLINDLCKNCLPSIDANAITSSYTLQPGQADFSTDLIGTIRNTSANNQLYPNIKVTVMGHQGLIGDLALSPKDYLDNPDRILGASNETRFMLTLDAAPEDIQSITIEPFY